MDKNKEIDLSPASDFLTKAIMKHCELLLDSGFTTKQTIDATEKGIITATKALTTYLKEQEEKGYPFMRYEW